MKKISLIKNRKFAIYAKKNSEDDNKKFHKITDHCHYTGNYRGGAQNIYNLRYQSPKEIPVVFHNGSTYDYHFIINELPKEFDDQFECLGENTEKYITFSVPKKKLSSLVKYLSERLHSEKCTYRKSHLDYMSVKDNQLLFMCFECKEIYI